MLAIASIVYCLLFHSNIHFKQERRKKNKINENNNDKNFYHGWCGLRKFIDGVDAINNIVVPRCFVSQNAYHHSITQKILYFYLFNPEKKYYSIIVSAENEAIFVWLWCLYTYKFTWLYNIQCICIYVLLMLIVYFAWLFEIVQRERKKN